MTGPDDDEEATVDEAEQKEDEGANVCETCGSGIAIDVDE